MRRAAAAAAGFALASCGRGSEGAPADVAEIARGGPCAKVERIVEASAARPAFSALTAEDALDGAVACRTFAETVPSEHWSAQDAPASIDRAAYVCTFLETPDTRDETRPTAYWQELVETFGLGCLEDWTAGGAARLDPRSSLRFRSFTLTPPGAPAPEDGARTYAPVSIDWRLSEDGDAAPEGQRVLLYVLAAE